MTIDRLIEVLLIVTTTFSISALIMPYIIRIANHIGALDIPRHEQGDRHIHKTIIPKFGGMCIFISFLVGYMLFGVHSVQMNAILIGSFFIILTGMIDDINSLSAKHQLIGQIAAALVIIFYGNITLSNLTAFGFNIEFGIWAYPITLFFILGCINVIRLIDGLDGLSGGISSIFFLTIGIISFLQQRFGTLEITLTFIMLGSVLGFLVYNFNPAKIFAGEIGATFMGFIIAVISLLGFKGALLTSVLVPLLILAIPILDTLFAIIRRVIKHKPVYEGDKDHFHHQLLKMNFSQRKTVLIVYFINILFSIAAIVYTINNQKLGIIMYIVLFILVLLFVLHTNIISDKLEEKTKNLEHKLIKNKHDDKKIKGDNSPKEVKTNSNEKDQLSVKKSSKKKNNKTKKSNKM